MAGRIIAAATGGLAVLLSLVPAAPAADAESEFRGRRLAETNCADCHAITRHDESANAAAPPFRHLARTRSLEALRADFLGDFFRRHPEMPEFEPTQGQADDIVDYIESIGR